MSHEYDHYSKEFKSRILALLIHYPEDSLHVIDPSYFTLPMHSQIALAIHKAYNGKDLKKVRLTATTLTELVLGSLRKNKETYVENKKAYLRTIRDLFEMQLPDHVVVLEEARAFALHARHTQALVDAEKQINAQNYDEVPKLFEELSALRKRENKNHVLPVSTLNSFLSGEKQFEEDAKYLVHPIVPKGGAILLYGLPKELKSWMAAALALDVASGRKALGFFDVRSPVKTLYVQVEDPEQLTRARLHELHQKQGTKKGYATFMLSVVPRCGLNLLDPEWLAALTKEIANSKAKLIILDVFRRLFRGNVADSKETAEFLAIIDKFRDMYGCAVLLVHHAKKGETPEMQTKALGLGIPDDADQCSGHADHRFRDDGDHDSGMMPITRSGMIPIS